MTDFVKTYKKRQLHDCIIEKIAITENQIEFVIDSRSGIFDKTTKSIVFYGVTNENILTTNNLVWIDDELATENNQYKLLVIAQDLNSGFDEVQLSFCFKSAYIS